MATNIVPAGGNKDSEDEDLGLVRKKYHPPELRTLGTLADLTKGGGRPVRDDGIDFNS